MEKKSRILVVDDSAVNLMAVEQKLKDIYEIIPINSGTRALRYLRNERPDLILLDIKMDDKNGIETLKEIRGMENVCDVPVIMLTSKNDRESVIQCQKLGAYGYVLKPFEVQILKDKIEHALEWAGNGGKPL